MSGGIVLARVSGGTLGKRYTLLCLAVAPGGSTLGVKRDSAFV